MESDTAQSIPLSRDRWLGLALDTLSEQGTSKFSLEALIRAMPVSKGSFYHHFKNREEFLFALVEFWDRHQTQNVIDAMEALPEGMTAEERLWELMCVVHETQSTRHELLIRSMALEFAEIQKAVAAVDRKRFEIVRRLFSAMGWEGDELKARTMAFVVTTSLDRLIFGSEDREDYERLLRSRYELFTNRA